MLLFVKLFNFECFFLFSSLIRFHFFFFKFSFLSFVHRGAICFLMNLNTHSPHHHYFMPYIIVSACSLFFSFFFIFFLLFSRFYEMFFILSCNKGMLIFADLYSVQCTHIKPFIPFIQVWCWQNVTSIPLMFWHFLRAFAYF